MESYLIYIGKVALAAGAFYIAFLLLFQNQKHFNFNRLYLPVSLAISFLIPLITFTSIKYIEPTNFDSNSFAFLANSTEIQQPVFVFEWYHYLFGLYILGVLGFLFHLLLGHLKAINIIKKSRVQKIFESLINITKKDVHPFSFFSKIVLSEKTLSHPDLEMIVSHEKIHVREKHTLDILFTEILFLFQWFNPFAWLIKDAVKNNLEYKTDNEIAKHYNPQTYQLAMVALADKKGVAPFLTALNGSQLKNRIIMMKKKTENKFAVVKQLAVLPLLAILVMGLSNREVKTEFVQDKSNEDIQVTKTFKNKIDPEFFSKIYKDGLLVLQDYGEAAPLIILNDEVVKEKVIIAETDLKWGEVIQPEQAIEKYGDKGKNGVLVFNTKDEYTGFKPGQVKQNISGKITDEKGDPIAGASILANGKKTGTISDIEGNFQINSNKKIEKISIGKSGYKSQNININNQKHLSVILQIEDRLYIVDGLETKNIDAIDPNDIESVDVLQGESGKELYGEKGKNGVIVIKTKNASIDKSIKDYENDTLKPPQVFKILKVGDDDLSNALYIVNGIEVDNLQDIKPDNVEKIDVLKGESATRIYGEKGKNGAVVVTTKQPVKFSSRNLPGNPIMIVDGKEFNGILNDIPIEDIANMSVLKNETAQTYVKIYGEKALNGVIIINTKTKYNTDQEKPKPLIVINGIISENKKIEDIDPETIESVNVLKDEMAVDKYGEKGKNGAIEIKLKPESIDTALKLRRFFAERIKYPVEAQENGVVGKISMAVTFDKNGKIVKTDNSSPKYDYLDEVVVTALNPQKKPHVQDNDSEILRQEMIRIINLLPAADIDDFKGKTINIVFTFQLQD